MKEHVAEAAPAAPATAPARRPAPRSALPHRPDGFVPEPAALLGLQRAAGNRAVTNLIQRREALDDRPGAELLELLDKLDAAATEASELAARRGEEPPTGGLEERLRSLRAIALGDDERAKGEALAAVRAELEGVGLVPATVEPVGRETVQRTNGRGTIAIVAVPLALGLGYLAWRTYEYIRDRREDALYERYAFQSDLPPVPIPPELTAGIGSLATDEQKLDRLFANVNGFRFSYTGGRVRADLAMATHRGDCASLVLIFQKVAASFGIEVRDSGVAQRMLVARGPIHGRDKLGNTDGETDWYFDEHFWAEYGGKEYDLLFMVSPRAPAALSTGSASHRGVTYYTFPDGREVVEGDARDARNPIRGAGKVFASHEETIAFLNSHRSDDGGEWRWV